MLSSFCYAMLTKDATAATLAAGLDPFVGIYHRPRFGRPALALDLMEEFRPLIADSAVLRMVNNGELGLPTSSGYRAQRAEGVSFGATGRAVGAAPPHLR